MFGWSFTCLLATVLASYFAESYPLPLVSITFLGVLALLLGWGVSQHLRRPRELMSTVSSGVEIRSSGLRPFVRAWQFGIPGLALWLIPDAPLYIRACGSILLTTAALLISS